MTDPAGQFTGALLLTPNAASEQNCRPLARPGDSTTPSGRVMSAAWPVDCAIGRSSSGNVIAIWKPVGVSVRVVCGVISRPGVKGTFPQPVGV